MKDYTMDNILETTLSDGAHVIIHETCVSVMSVEGSALIDKTAIAELIEFLIAEIDDL